MGNSSSKSSRTCRYPSRGIRIYPTINHSEAARYMSLTPQSPTTMNPGLNQSSNSAGSEMGASPTTSQSEAKPTVSEAQVQPASTTAGDHSETVYHFDLTQGRDERPRNRLGYVLEIPIPTDNTAIQAEIKGKKATVEDNIQYLVPEFRHFAIKQRLREHVGFREWSYTLGEPFDEHHLQDNQSPTGLYYAHDISRNDATYAARRRRFDYTRGEDPLFRGRSYRIGRGNALVARANPGGKHAFELDEDDQNYVPETEEVFSKYPVRLSAAERAKLADKSLTVEYQPSKITPITKEEAEACNVAGNRPLKKLTSYGQNVGKSIDGWAQRQRMLQKKR